MGIWCYFSIPGSYSEDRKNIKSMFFFPFSVEDVIYQDSERTLCIGAKVPLGVAIDRFTPFINSIEEGSLLWEKCVGFFFIYEQMIGSSADKEKFITLDFADFAYAGDGGSEYFDTIAKVERFRNSVIKSVKAGTGQPAKKKKKLSAAKRREMDFSRQLQTQFSRLSMSSRTKNIFLELAGNDKKYVFLYHAMKEMTTLLDIFNDRYNYVEEPELELFGLYYLIFNNINDKSPNIIDFYELINSDEDRFDLLMNYLRFAREAYEIRNFPTDKKSILNDYPEFFDLLATNEDIYKETLLGNLDLINYYSFLLEFEPKKNYSYAEEILDGMINGITDFIIKSENKSGEYAYAEKILRLYKEKNNLSFRLSKLPDAYHKDMKLINLFKKDLLNLHATTADQLTLNREDEYYITNFIILASFIKEERRGNFYGNSALKRETETMIKTAILEQINTQEYDQFDLIINSLTIKGPFIIDQLPDNYYTNKVFLNHFTNKKISCRLDKLEFPNNKQRREIDVRLLINYITRRDPPDKKHSRFERRVFGKDYMEPMLCSPVFEILLKEMEENEYVYFEEIIEKLKIYYDSVYLDKLPANYFKNDKLKGYIEDQFVHLSFDIFSGLKYHKNWKDILIPIAEMIQNELKNQKSLIEKYPTISETVLEVLNRP